MDWQEGGAPALESRAVTMSFFLVLSPTTTAQALVQQCPCWQPPAPISPSLGLSQKGLWGQGRRACPEQGCFLWLAKDSGAGLPTPTTRAQPLLCEWGRGTWDADQGRTDPQRWGTGWKSSLSEPLR